MRLANILLATALALGSATAAAAVTFEVTDNPGGQALAAETVADMGTFTQSLTKFDSVSINVNACAACSSGSLFFTFAPSPLNATADIILDSIDFADFGNVTVTLSDGVKSVNGTVTAASSELILTGVALSSPLQVAFAWTTATTGSFNADLSLAPVPVPAAGLLLLSGLGVLTLAKRRKTA